MLDKQTTHAVGWTLHDGSLVQVFVEYQELGQVSPAEIPTGGAQVGGKPWLPARWQPLSMAIISLHGLCSKHPQIVRILSPGLFLYLRVHFQLGPGSQVIHSEKKQTVSQPPEEASSPSHP